MMADDKKISLSRPEYHDADINSCQLGLTVK